MSIKSDTVNKITQYENGEMSREEVLEFFAELIKNGTCWKLQGSYGRMARDFIESGFIDTEGNILRYFEENEG
jgi:hypothetical protein